MKLRATFVVSISLFVAACGSSGSGDGPPTSNGVSAGADRSILSSEAVSITPSATNPDVVAYEWIQSLGPSVDFAVAAAGALSFAAPPFGTVLEFNVSGLRADGSAVGSDRVIVTVEALGPAISGATLATIDVNGGGEGRAFASAFHAASGRLFVIDQVAREVVVYSTANPGSPALVGTISAPADLPGFRATDPLAIGCGDEGVVAITWSGETIEFPGRLQLIDPLTLAELRSISTTGAAPVDVDVTPDGRTIAIACAGAPTFIGQGDGRGYVTLVQVPLAGAASIAIHQDVAPIPFSAFDGDEASLEALGVRFFTPVPLASIDLSPRTVALSEDGAIAWAGAPENNCLLTIDVTEKLVRQIEPMGDRPNGALDRGTALIGSQARVTSASVRTTASDGTAIAYGGIQGLVGVEFTSSFVSFDAVTGAGPTLAPVDLDQNGELELPFVTPGLAQEVARFTLDSPTGVLSAASEGLALTRNAGGQTVESIDGLPTSSAGEAAIDLLGSPVATSSKGAYFAGGTREPSGAFWLADARDSALWQFDASGLAQEVFAPVGSSTSGATLNLPEALGRRPVQLDAPEGRRFGGFGAIAHHAGRGTVSAMTRLPLDGLGGPVPGARIVRLFEFDPVSRTTVGEYVYVLEAAGHAVEGMTTALGSGAFGSDFAIMEAAPEDGEFRGVFRVDLAGATNLRSLSPANYADIDAALEATAPRDLADLGISTFGASLVPTKKTLIADLVAAGLGEGRPTGLAISGDAIIVVTDDGFGGAAGASFSSSSAAIGTITPRPTVVAVGEVRGINYDTAVDGQRAPANGAVPATGLSQPLDLVSITGAGPGGSFAVAMANGGLPRVLLDDAGGPPNDERVRAGDLTLDTNAFPSAANWTADPFGGDLIVSDRDADLNGDGFAERLALFGSRSLALAGEDARVTWTSSPLMNTRAEGMRPERHDAASTTSGIQPSALCVVELGAAPVLLSALEGVGLISAHSLRNPSAPLIAGMFGTVSEPSDVDAISDGANSALVAVTDRSAGRIVIQRIVRTR